MRFLRRAMAGAFLSALTLGLLAFAGATLWSALQTRWADAPKPRPARERVFAADVVTVDPQTIRPVLSTYGEVRARRTLEIRASAPGEVVWLADGFEDGGRVEAGDLLVRIDPAAAQSALDTARADLSEAEADLADARRSLALAADDIKAAEAQAALREAALQRQLDLQTRGVGSQAAVETAELAASAANQAVLSRRQAEAAARTRVDQAATALDRRRIALTEAQRRLDDTEIRAAFPGVLSGVTLTEGRLVSTNESLGQLIDPAALDVSFRVSTAQYTRLVATAGRIDGAPVTVSLGTPDVDLTASGRISRAAAEVGQGQTGRLLFARLDGGAGFRPGDFVSVSVEEPALDGVARLPAAAVDAAGTVLVVGADERLSVAPVEVLRREGDDVIVAATDLAGQEVVAERTPLLGAGIRIRPVRPAGATDTAAIPAEPEFLSLDPERRARLVAFIESNAFMPDDAKKRVLAQLSQDKVPARVVRRIEERMGG